MVLLPGRMVSTLNTRDFQQMFYGISFGILESLRLFTDVDCLY